MSQGIGLYKTWRYWDRLGVYPFNCGEYML